MTQWLSGEALPKDFLPLYECQLRHPDPDGGVISCKHQDLGAAEVRIHVRNGKYAVKLAMQWRERLSFVLHDDLSIKRLRFEDVIREATQDAAEDDPVSRFDRDFSLMVLELSEFLPALLVALGGEIAPDKAAAGKHMPKTAAASYSAVEAEPA
jgi:recombination associated protein RdgC